MYKPGEKVIFIPENKVYDFGYYSATKGKCILYKPGERNMQDSIAVNLTDIKKKTNFRMCSVCLKNETNEPLTHLSIYITGSEGIDVCLDCRLSITEFVRQLRKIASSVKIRTVKEQKK